MIKLVDTMKDAELSFFHYWGNYGYVLNPYKTWLYFNTGFFEPDYENRAISFLQSTSEYKDL